VQTSEKQLTIFIALFNIAATRHDIPSLATYPGSYYKIHFLVHQIFLFNQKAE
jgi:hypothetical protein